MRAIRGRDISMIFQDPMTCAEPGAHDRAPHDRGLEVHLGLSQFRRRRRADRTARRSRHPQGRRAHQRLPAPVQRRHAPARDDRHGALLQPASCSSPTSPRPRSTSPSRRRSCDLLKKLSREHRARRSSLITHDLGVVAGMCRPGRRHVRRAHRRERPGRTALRRPAASVHARAAQERAAARRAARATRCRRIPGLPPDLAHLPPGCPFAPRCSSPRTSAGRTRRSSSPTASERRSACCHSDQLKEP